jgi:prepilin-type N-terminal cleavage/methylation domain-containing protein
MILHHRPETTNQRGFTLLETTLALALLGILSMVAVSWTTSTLQLRTRSMQSDARNRAIGDVERALRIDLLNHDITTPTRLRREERVWITDEQLHILTRDGGDAHAVYLFQDGFLIRTATRLGPESDPNTTTLIGPLDAAAFVLTSTETDTWANLTLTLRDSTGESTIQLTIPREWSR